MSYPLVSVILATYNGLKYLPESIGSILAQDYKNLELIIIDDASTDPRVSEILEKYKNEDSRVRAFRNEKNMERSWSKNFGVNQAKGEFIAFIDDDDHWATTKISEQIEILKQNKDIGIIGTYARFIDEGGSVMGISNHLKTNAHDIYENILFSNQFIHSSVVIKKKIFQEVGGFPEFNLCEDYDLWLRVLRISKGMNLVKPLTTYLIRSSSTTSRHIYRMKWQTIRIIWKYRSFFPGAFRALIFKTITFAFDIGLLIRIRSRIK